MKRSTDGVPIAVVEQETGLSKDVLRKWETRYKYPVPGRDGHGDRVYTRDQVERLRTIKRLLDGGYRPSKLLGMSAKELAQLDGSSVRADRGGDAGAVIPELLALLKAHQPARLRAALARLLQSQGLNRFVQDTMAPMSAAVGEAWLRGDIHVFEEHLFSEIASAILRQSLDAMETPEGRPRILMSTLRGEKHALGLLMAACLFTLRGAHCVYLGTETPSEDLAQATRAHDANAVALSFSSAYPARRIRPALLELRKTLARDIGVVAGGAGVARQPPLAGVVFMKDFTGIDDYVAPADLP
jgi:methanogenic corrinoid protein MtbC1